MTNWVGTNTGNVITLEGPVPIDLEQITIEDIATGLSNVCRFNGQIRQWYSVAEHSIHVAELVPNKYKLQALLHDATEAYICDVPTPLKRMLGNTYYDVEARLAEAIGQKFGVKLGHGNLDACVEYADRMMLLTERDSLQAVPGDWGPTYEGVNRYPYFRCQYASPNMARHAFLERFNEYMNL